MVAPLSQQNNIAMPICLPCCVLLQMLLRRTPVPVQAFCQQAAAVHAAGEGRQAEGGKERA